MAATDCRGRIWWIFCIFALRSNRAICSRINQWLASLDGWLALALFRMHKKGGGLKWKAMLRLWIPICIYFFLNFERMERLKRSTFSDDQQNSPTKIIPPPKDGYIFGHSNFFWIFGNIIMFSPFSSAFALYGVFKWTDKHLDSD